MIMKKLFLALAISSLMFSQISSAVEKTVLRIGFQTAGTLDWELSLLEQSPAFEIQALPFATADATKIALQSGAVDMIVSDWLFVSQARNNGADFAFYPYSNLSGALVVTANSPIQNIKDLVDKRLGIVGGEFDKNWLLLQAVGKLQQIDLNTRAEKIFGAPPLISEQLKNQRVDAVLTYWHFAASLEALGYKQLLNGQDLQKALGISETVPTLGYVFNQSWANKNQTALKTFFAATKEAKNRLCDDDSTWKKATAKVEFASPILRKHYCDGRINEWTEANQAAANKLYNILVGLNPKIGRSANLAEGTFW